MRDPQSLLFIAKLRRRALLGGSVGVKPGIRSCSPQAALCCFARRQWPARFRHGARRGSIRRRRCGRNDGAARRSRGRPEIGLILVLQDFLRSVKTVPNLLIFIPDLWVNAKISRKTVSLNEFHHVSVILPALDASADISRQLRGNQLVETLNLRRVRHIDGHWQGERPRIDFFSARQKVNFDLSFTICNGHR